MAIWAAVVGVLGGAAINSSGSAAAKKGNKLAGSALKKANKKVNETLAPYSSVGESSLYRLASLMGIEGYRTEAEIAYTKFLATKPTPPGFIGANAGGINKLIDEHPARQLLGDDGASIAAGLGPPGSQILTPITSSIFDRNDKDKEAAARARAKKRRIALAAYNTELSTWQTESDRLKGDFDKSMVGYSPGKARSDYLQSTPGYNFRFDEGLRALDASGSSRGDLLSGQATKGKIEYGQNLASQEFGAEFSRLMSLSGIGQNAASIKANAAVGAGSGLANLASLQGQQGQQTASNYNDLLQGGLQNYAYLSNRDNNNRGSSFNSNTLDISPVTNSFNDFNRSSEEVLGKY